MLAMTFSETERESRSTVNHPLFSLTEEELDVVQQLVLASGSLKELARVYQVSYPTIRAKVDRLIERVQKIVEGTTPDPMMQLLANLVERGEITVSAARSVRDLYRQKMEQQKESI